MFLKRFEHHLPVLALEERRQLDDLDALHPAFQEILYRESAAPPVSHPDHDLVDGVPLSDGQQRISRRSRQDERRGHIVLARLSRDIADDLMTGIALRVFRQSRDPGARSQDQHARLERAQILPPVKDDTHAEAAGQCERHRRGAERD
jgi:hypothetical protein